MSKSLQSQVTESSYRDTTVTGHGTALIGDNYGTLTINHAIPSQVAPGAHPKSDILLGSLPFDRWDARLRNVKPALDKTCQWVFAHQVFQNWIFPESSGSCNHFLWIRGKPGSGKSTIMKEAVAWVESSLAERTVLSYFFNARSPDELEKSVLGLYRSLTYQLLNAYPVAVKQFTKNFSGKVRNDKMSEEWTVSELQNFWYDYMTKNNAPSFVIFVDALDEGLDEDEIRNMIDNFVDLTDHSQAPQSPFFFCFSSRHFPNITIGGSLEIVVEQQDGHKQDIEHYVSKKLKGKPGARLRGLRQRLIDRSQRVFLWAVLAVGMLNKLYDQGCSHYARAKVLEDLPKELYGIFNDALERASHDAQSEGTQAFHQRIKLFRWVLFSLRPLNLEELEDVLHLEMIFEGNAANYSNDDYNDDEGYSDDDDSGNDEELQDSGGMQRAIVSISSGLIELTRSPQPVVQFIHETIRDFLLGKSRIGSESRATDDNTFTAHFQPQTCHNAIAEECLLYLTALSNGSKPLNTHHKPLARYAAEYWWQHASAAGVHMSESVSSLAKDFYLDPAKLLLWNRIYDVDLAQCSSETGSLDHHMLSPPIYYAALTGRSEIVKLAIDGGADINARGGQHNYALTAAAAQGYEDTVEVLLENGADVNARWGHTRNIEAEAPGCGRTEAEKLSLDPGVVEQRVGRAFGRRQLSESKVSDEIGVRIVVEEHISFNSPESCFYSAIYAASEKGFAKVVSRLIDADAYVERRRDCYGDALRIAARRGHKTVADLLINAGTDVDFLGGSPLQEAVLNSHIDVVRLLLEKGAAVTSDQLISSIRDTDEQISKLLRDHGASRE